MVRSSIAGETLAFDLKSPLGREAFSVRQPVLYRSLQAANFRRKR
jgi:hypothetical protein